MNDIRPILSTTVHRLAPVQPRFAFWPEKLGFYPVQQTKTRDLPARNSTPSREMHPESAEILRLTRQHKLNSP